MKCSFTSWACSASLTFQSHLLRNGVCSVSACCILARLWWCREYPRMPFDFLPVIREKEHLHLSELCSWKVGWMTGRHFPASWGFVLRQSTSHYLGFFFTCSLLDYTLSISSSKQEAVEGDFDHVKLQEWRKGQQWPSLPTWGKIVWVENVTFKACFSAYTPKNNSS